ncbi:FAD-dependent oxidoreductase [Thauera humireducens]|uniref:FAD-dependent oxidoreductase n=1 Tax=Thauera humireducens TaxID=1134435 RepID=UPI00311FF48E
MSVQDQSRTEWDVIVVGSGAGAMTSAVVAADQGLSVLVVEKSEKFGGTSAISGGGIWIPNNHYFAAKGGKDSYDKALQYILAAGGGKADETKVRAYLDHAPEMIKYLEEKSGCATRWPRSTPITTSTCRARCPAGARSTPSCSTPARSATSWRTCAGLRPRRC